MITGTIEGCGELVEIALTLHKIKSIANDILKEMLGDDMSQRAHARFYIDDDNEYGYKVTVDEWNPNDDEFLAKFSKKLDDKLGFYCEVVAEW